MTNVEINLGALASYRAKGCVICGEEDTDVIELHHVDPAEKDFTLSGGALRKNILVFAAELAKTVPLCRHCHRRVELGVIDLPEEN